VNVLELKFAIYHRAEVCHLSQSSKSVLTGFLSRCRSVVLAKESLTRFSSNTESTEDAEEEQAEEEEEETILTR